MILFILRCDTQESVCGTLDPKIRLAPPECVELLLHYVHRDVAAREENLFLLLFRHFFLDHLL